MRRKRIFIFISATVIAFIILSGAGIVDLYTKWLFFNEIRYPDVFTKILSTRILVGSLFGVFSLAFILINVIVANRINFLYIDLFQIEQTRISLRTEGLNRVIKPLSIVAGIIAGLFAGFWGSMVWKEVLIYQNSMGIGMNDPIFGRDFSFYMFKLPLLEFIKSFLGFAFMVTLLLISINYLLRGGIAAWGNKISIDGRVKRHIGILAGLFIVNISFGFYLDKFKLLLSEHGVIFGAGYTDIYARLPALNILIILTFITGIIFITGIFIRSWKMALFPIGFSAMAYVIGLIIYPTILQNFKVSPNELALEKPFIEHNIKFTRFGYDLERIEVRPFNVSYNLTFREIQKNHATIKNIRLWDDTPLLKTYSQLQQIRTYYKFTGIDNDRYMINGEYMQVMMSPRELSYDDLPSKSWINEKIVFTHGNGITMGPVSRITREGLPEFIIKDIPPVSTSDIKITIPEIYFGEFSSNYVIVKTKIPEFSYPTSEGNVYTSYKGTGGIELSSFARRLVFASKFNTAKIFLSSDITSESRILYNRNIIERVRLIAPFLIYDTDPYIVVSKDGRLFWLIDAYTISNRIPYSKPSRRINYIRNSVKVSVDAYNGSVNFYISDPDDVMVKVYSAIFPQLFKSLSEMPDDLRKHIRYPQGLLRVQARMFAIYHMTDPKVFYNKEDLWEIPVYGNKSMEPYYTIMRLPEDKKEEYILLLPYTPAKRDNLAAWLSARCDEPNYGRLIVYAFPRDRLVFGPRQIDARIDQDAYISQQLTLWGQRGSQVIRGSLLVIPLESSLLYIQPLYLAAEDKGGLPELRRVIVAYENNVIMEENLEFALQRLFGGRKVLPAKEKLIENVRASIDELAKDAMQAYERAIELLRQKDWAGYGEQMKRLEQILKRMIKK